MSIFDPEKQFSSITSIDVEWDLLRAHLRYALLDIDNTIRRRDNHEVPEDVLNWLARAQGAGVKLCLLSNNFHADTYSFARALDIPLVAKALKPLPIGYKRALAHLNAPADETVMIGDQLFTDVVGAHLAGMAAYFVEPLVDLDLKHTLLLRKLEKRILERGESMRAPSNYLIE